MQQFLSRILSAPGVEELIETVEIRRAQRDQEDDFFRSTVNDDAAFAPAAAFARIYRERADGDEYRRIQQLLIERARGTEGSLTLQQDLYVDWSVLAYCHPSTRQRSDFRSKG